MPDTTSPAVTTTFLFTDIAGSTRLWAEHRDAMSAALARHDALLRTVVEEQGGTVFKTVGDAVCAAFPAPLGALAAAVAGQRALAAEDWSAFAPDLPPLTVRMAVHSGVAEPRDGDWFGQPLNRGARLLAIGHGGQVLVSRATEELVVDQLPGEVSLRDLGEHRLKDLARPERVFQVVAAGLVADFPPLASVDARPNNLPLLPYPLLGRAGELADLRALLTAGDTRLVTLTGPGGTGKTRLALAAAAECLDAFRHGAFFVDLAPLTDPTLVPATVASALGLVESPGEPIAVTLTAWLAHKRLLLVLDNFEQILPAGAFVAELLAACADLRVLVTSRAPLRLRWERELPLAPMPVPERPEQATPETVTRYAAVELFVQRATDARPDFRVTAENAAAIAQICARLDGLPLAIELAAARVRALTPGAILDRLGQQLRLLAGGARDLPERQQTMRAAIAWSYELLPAEQQRLFRWLAVFMGGWTLEAAEAVCGADGGDAQSGDAGDDVDVWEDLPALVEQSLVRQVVGPVGEARYTMLETIRAYGLEQLAAAGELEAARAIHARHFAEWARAAGPEICRRDQRAWINRLDADIDNLRALFAWAVQRDPDLGLLAAADLEHWWWKGNHLDEGAEIVAALLDAPGAGEVPRAMGRVAAGRIAYAQGNMPHALASSLASLDICERLGWQPGIMRALDVRVSALMFSSPSDVTEPLERYARIAASMGDDLAVANTVALRSMAMFMLEDYVEAIRLAEASVSAYRRLGNSTEVACWLNNLGYMLISQGNLHNAARHLIEAIDIATAINSMPTLVASLDSLGRLHLRQGDSDTASDVFARALRLSATNGLRSGVRSNMEGMAMVRACVEPPLDGVVLMAAVSALLERLGQERPPVEAEQVAATTAALRATLGDAAFEAAWARGLAMTTDEAVEYALAVAGDGDRPDEPQIWSR